MIHVLQGDVSRHLNSYMRHELWPQYCQYQYRKLLLFVETVRMHSYSQEWKFYASGINAQDSKTVSWVQVQTYRTHNYMILAMSKSMSASTVWFLGFCQTVKKRGREFITVTPWFQINAFLGQRYKRVQRYSSEPLEGTIWWVLTAFQWCKIKNYSKNFLIS